MDGSRRSAHGNAYFTGLGRAKRIVFFDTLLQRLQPSEIEAVLAHELGHFKRRHIAKRLAFSFFSSLVFLGLLGWLAGRSWFYQGLGVTPALDGSHTRRGAGALQCWSCGVHLRLAPIASRISRKHEFEADAFAVAHTSGDDLASALVKLYEDNAATLTPDPVHSAFYDSHPRRRSASPACRQRPPEATDAQRRATTNCALPPARGPGGDGAAEVAEQLAVLPQWRLLDGAIARTYHFTRLLRDDRLRHALAWMVHARNHHPDLVVGYNRCEVRFNTHSVAHLGERFHRRREGRRDLRRAARRPCRMSEAPVRRPGSRRAWSPATAGTS